MVWLSRWCSALVLLYGRSERPIVVWRPARVVAEGRPGGGFGGHLLSFAEETGEDGVAEVVEALVEPVFADQEGVDVSGWSGRPPMGHDERAVVVVPVGSVGMADEVCAGHEDVRWQLGADWCVDGAVGFDGGPGVGLCGGEGVQPVSGSVNPAVHVIGHVVHLTGTVVVDVVCVRVGPAGGEFVQGGGRSKEPPKEAIGLVDEFRAGGPFGPLS